MNDRAVELLEQYELGVLRTRKGRGAILCDTERGCLILKEYTGSLDRIELQNRLLKQITACGQVEVEAIVRNKEGSLLALDENGARYILKTWQEGRECNIHEKEECMEAVRVLARLHESMTISRDFLAKEEPAPGLPPVFSPGKEYDKHNKELRRVRKYLQQKGQKTWFELSLLKAFDVYLEQAVSVTERWLEYNDQIASPVDEERISFCHGDYQYHNILFGDNGWFLVNFERYVRDNPVRDLYLLLRKLLEKGNWQPALGAGLLEAYEKERPLSKRDRVDLYYRLAYPEKFWKIVNFYYNSRKSWIPGKNQEKLERLLAQEKEKQQFLREVFCGI